MTTLNVNAGKCTCSYIYRKTVYENLLDKFDEFEKCYCA